MKLCVSTSSCSVLVNCRPQGGWFQPQRGIRQGCPLAPLLFILAVDTLAFCTTRLCSRGHLLGFQTTSIVGGIPLLQYADDTTLYPRIGNRGPHPISDDGGFHRFLWTSTESSQVHHCRLWTRCRRAIPLRRDPSNTDRDTSHSIPGPAVNRSPSSDTRLAARDGKGGVTSGWMAGEIALPGRPSNFGEVSPLCAPDVLHVGIPDAGRSAAASREHYAAVLLAWDRYGARGSSNCMGFSLPTSLRWRSWHTSPAP